MSDNIDDEVVVVEIATAKKYVKTLISKLPDMINDKPEVMMRRYKHVLTMSENTIMANYFVNHPNILQEMLNAVNSKPDVVEIVICIINNVCSKDETMILIIGNDLSFVSSILSHLESKHELLQLSVLRFLKVAVHTIRNNCAPSWLRCASGHLKKNESLGRSILVILEFEFTESNEKLIETVIDLVKEMAETKLNRSADGNSNQSNFLEEIHVNGVSININDIIYKITIRCKQMVEWKRKREKQINLELTYNWLSIMTIMKTKIAVFYNELNLHGVIVECLVCVFNPYREVLLSELITDKRPKIIDLISKYAYLLPYLEYNLSHRINNILMRTISSLKIVLGVVSKTLKSDSDKFLDALKNDNKLTILLYDPAYSISNPKATRLLNLQLSLPNLLRNLEEAWLNMVKHLYKSSIKDLVLLIEPFYDEKDYFLQLLVHKRILDEKSVKKIENKINKIILLFGVNEEK
ncbi:uncharacterized protein LOC112458801 [Temnothorax curvispinosus]|uniref:Uncharacterized protein LOC112458801 n=1 Tax=Temnothorax curvispinosus TaxID=300111 RepID=A0A6J1Q812_9HYME|nr:uncharacterized protein LOC112458801 [Temnothorax curvispinosus]XP_024878374.1 uncharacterized protein LOC112458801 [Temnothorax curvispinosus]